MTLISPDYLALNQDLHTQHAGYGHGGWKWIGPAVFFAQEQDATSLLDYGCGKPTFDQWFPVGLGIRVHSYDPVTAPADPPICDFTVCLDVLEHIEPHHLDEVLDHLTSKTRKAALLVISTREAKKVLQDGRNAHLIVEDETWWCSKLSGWFAEMQVITAPELTRPDQVVLLVWNPKKKG